MLLRIFIFLFVFAGLLFPVHSYCYAIDGATLLSDQTLVRREQLKDFTIEAELTLTANGETNSAQCEFTMAGRDSISMHITGPFGISVAKLFATNDYFLFLDALRSRAIEGVPSSENLEKVTFMPLSFQDYTALLRAEPPGNPLEFIWKEQYDDSTSLLYSRATTNGGIEFVLCSNQDGTIKQYQRKAKDGSIEISMVYSDYTEIDSVKLPQTVALQAPKQQLQMIVKSSSITLKDIAKQSMRFRIPSSIKPIKMD